MSLSSLLSIGRSALQAQEKVVTVIGHNIANAETPGYSRQRVDLAAASPDGMPPLGLVGRGVQVVDIARVRSSFYDTSWRREASGQGQYQTLQRQLSQISGILGEPGDTGLGVTLDNLIDSFNSLANNPVDPTARSIVAANATALTDQFRSIDSRLQDVNSQIGQELGQQVQDANATLDQLGELNVQLTAAHGQAPDLLDQRDQLLDKLSQQVDIRVTDRGNGTVDVTLGGGQLLSAGGQVQHLSVSGGGPYTVSYGNPPIPATVSGGQIKGLLDSAVALGSAGTGAARGTGLRGQLDDLALGIVSAVNQIHSNYDPTNNPLQPTITPAPSPLRNVIPFFDPAGVTAGTIALNPTIAADPTQIAAGYSTAPGDTSIAFQLAQLRNLTVPVPGATAATGSSPAVTAGSPQVLGDFYTSVVSGLAVKAQDAGTRADAASTLVDQIDAQRQDDSGVSVDEEMVKLIEHQQAYAAAARLITTANDMLTDLINLGR